MPGPAIQWKTFENETWVASVATRGRYKIAVPRKVTGTPTLAMAAAGQTATIKIYPEDCGKPGGEITLSGTTATPLVDATGNVISGQDLVDMSLEVVSLSSGASIVTTDEPNGSPSAPFATLEALAAAYPVAGAVPLQTPMRVSPGVEYRYQGGVGVGAWQEMPQIVGAYPGFGDLPITARDGAIATIPGTLFVWGAV